MSNVAVVTGGTRGIGRQIVNTLAKQGYDISINYRSENDDLAEVIEEVKALGRNIYTYKCDISDFESTENFIKNTINEFGKIDVLVNNAGITKDRSINENEKRRF